MTPDELERVRAREREAQRRRRERLRELNLCAKCAQAERNASGLCDDCQEWKQDYMDAYRERGRELENARRARLRAEGRCTQCRAPSPTPTCAACRERDTNYHRGWRARQDRIRELVGQG